MALIEVEGLYKTYHTPARDQPILRRLFSPVMTEKPALQGISFSIEEGQTVAYIGPNGSGKSTTIKCMTGILQPDKGRVSVNGMTPWAERIRLTRHIGVLFGQKSLLFWDLPVYDALLLYKAIYRIGDDEFNQRIQEFEAAFSIRPLLNTPVRRLSLGERMRCELLAALLHSPRVLFLDEPTIGFDVVARAQFHEFLLRYQKEKGLTLVLTTHQVSDIEGLCEHVIVILRGKVLFQGPTSELKRRFGNDTMIDVEYYRILDPELLTQVENVVSFFEMRNGNKIRLVTTRETISLVLGLLTNALDIQALYSGDQPLEKILVEVFQNGSGATV